MDATDLDEHLPGIVAGDAAAFARWLAGAEPPLRRSLSAFAAHVDVEAVVQEALLRAWQVAPRVTPDGRPNGLLRLSLRAARNLALDEVRSARVRLREDVPAEREEALGAASPAPPDPLLRRVIAACWELLPAQPSAALRARLDSAGTDADALLAERCGMRPNTFLQNVARARKHLVACLEKHGVSLELFAAGDAP